MDIGILGHVFTDELDADVEQFQGVQGGSAHFRHAGSVGSDAVEPVVLDGNGLAVVGNAEAGPRMPVDTEINIVESASVDHVDLADTAFFCRAGEVLDGAFHIVFFQILPEDISAFHAAAAKQVMAAAVARGTAFHRVQMITVCLLAQARQGIQFTQDTDDRRTVSGCGDERRVHVRQHTHFKPEVFHALLRCFMGFVFREIQFRCGPDLICALLKNTFVLFGELSDFFSHHKSVISIQCFYHTTGTINV